MALASAFKSWRLSCPKCPQMPTALREAFTARTSDATDAAAMQWLKENSKPCPHGATFDELRERLDLPVRRKLPKHVRGYLEDAIDKGTVKVVVTDDGIRYVASRGGARAHR